MVPTWLRRPLPRSSREAPTARPSSEKAEGYVTRIALDKDDLITGYEFINLGKMMDFIKKGDDANVALEKAKGSYGRFAGAAKYIDPRHE